MTDESATEPAAPTSGEDVGALPRRARPDHRYPTWAALRWLFLCRLALLIGLILLFSPPALDPLITADLAELAWDVLIVYALLVLFSGVTLYFRWPGRESQVLLAIYTDLIALTLLMHAGGGVSSGLGMLLAVAVAAGALMMEGRLALLIASLATLAVLTEQIYADLQGATETASYTQAGLLGTIFFAVALIAHVLYQRVREAEALAARRTVDIANLTKLNAFIIENLRTGVLVVDGERRLRLTNKAALTLLDAEAVTSRESLRDLSNELADWLKAEVHNPKPEGGVLRVGTRQVRASLTLLGDYRASGALVYLRDQQELTHEAQQIKLAALGTLTASIAHNIRNPLSAISHASELFADGKDLPEEDRHLLDIIRRNSARIDETVTSVMQLSRRNQLEPVAIDLSAWLRDLAGELRETYRLSAEQLTLEISAPPDPVHVDPRHLHQIVANLCENAVIHGGGPNRTGRAEIRLTGPRGGEHGPVIEISDNGPGIDEAIVYEIFNPFFTTKSTGTGLGLYIARELAETNGIRLTYEPARPHGSRFKLLFAG